MENLIQYKVLAPAKVNLFLAVGAVGQNYDIYKIKDTYHPILSIFHTLLLKDLLFINVELSDNFKIDVGFDTEKSSVNIPKIKTEDNICYKAIDNLVKKLDKKPNVKIDITVQKHIPYQAGLGGGSSDAAAALACAAKIFALSVDDRKIQEAAKETGADVPFFLKGGCALYGGCGDVLEHSLQPYNRPVVIVMPKSEDNSKDSGLSTEHVYSHFDTMPEIAADFTQPIVMQHSCDSHCHEHHDCDCVHGHHDCDSTHEPHGHCGCDKEHHDCDCGHENQRHNLANLLQAVRSLEFADNVPLFNNLALASYEIKPELIDIKNWLGEICGEENVLLAGSGSATFAICENEEKANFISQQSIKNGHWAVTSQLANIKARLMPNL